jgi:taspase (threonine aspartase 1)
VYGESSEGSRSSSSLRDVQDTVGAVAWHPKDGAAASVSSGGILLKLPGRVGEVSPLLQLFNIELTEGTCAF